MEREPRLHLEMRSQSPPSHSSLPSPSPTFGSASSVSACYNLTALRPVEIKTVIPVPQAGSLILALPVPDCLDLDHRPSPDLRPAYVMF